MSTITDPSAGASGVRDRRAVIFWLYAVAVLVFAMIVVGGITRLTESGLSMVEWRPVTGWLPPLSEAAWQAEFEKYKAFPEYQKVNAGMSLADFKTIYAWEFGHRLLGRIIGLAFVVPLIFFLVTGRIRRSEAPWFGVLLLAGGSQGALGWYMVQSGLIDNPDVSQYRLAAHLSLAFAIYALLVWTAWALRAGSRAGAAVTGGFRTAATILGILVAMQIVIGAFVAGTNAGFAYSTWPTMDGDLIPPYMFDTSPWWLAAFEDVTTIQFLHRTVGYLVALAAIWLFIVGRRLGRPASAAAAAALHLVAIQIILGIATLLMVVPVWLGALHQAMAVLVWTAAVYALRLGWIGRDAA